MPKHGRDSGDATEPVREQPLKKGAHADVHVRMGVSTPPQRKAAAPDKDKERADADHGAGGENSEGQQQLDEQKRRQYVEWTLEDVDDKPMHLRYCSEQPPPLAKILTGIPVHVNLPGGRQRNGELKFNPISTRWFVAAGDRNMNLASFCEGALSRHAAGKQASLETNTNWLPRDVLLETETDELAIPQLEHLAIPTRQWFIYNRDELLGLHSDVRFPSLSVSTNRRSRARQSAAGARAGAGNAPEILKKKKEEGAPPNPFNCQGLRFQPAVPNAVGVCLNPCDRAPPVRLLDPLTAAGNRGYRTIRATHGVGQGTWYFEVTFREDTPQMLVEDRFHHVKGQIRLGWARSAAELQAPVGFDRFGYAFASKTGEKIHNRKTEGLSRPLKTGDVVGCYIHLPDLESEPQQDMFEEGVAPVPSPAGQKRDDGTGQKEGSHTVAASLQDPAVTDDSRRGEGEGAPTTDASAAPWGNGSSAMGLPATIEQMDGIATEEGLGAGEIGLPEVGLAEVQQGTRSGERCVDEASEPDALTEATAQNGRGSELEMGDGGTGASKSTAHGVEATGTGGPKDPDRGGTPGPGASDLAAVESAAVESVASGTALGEGTAGSGAQAASGGGAGGRDRSKKSKSRGKGGGAGDAASGASAAVVPQPLIWKSNLPQPGGTQQDVTVLACGPIFGRTQKDKKGRDLLQWKTGVHYFVDQDDDAGSQVHANSCVAFFVNGECDQVAFAPVMAGTYYPAVSLYMGGTASFNFGPDFEFPPSAEHLDALNLKHPEPIILLQPPKEPEPEPEQDSAMPDATADSEGRLAHGAGARAEGAGGETPAESFLPASLANPRVVDMLGGASEASPSPVPVIATCATAKAPEHASAQGGVQGSPLAGPRAASAARETKSESLTAGASCGPVDPEEVEGLRQEQGESGGAKPVNCGDTSS